jgi:hypothetical protein
MVAKEGDQDIEKTQVSRTHLYNLERFKVFVLNSFPEKDFSSQKPGNII